jgi:ankyrin repeat protein
MSKILKFDDEVQMKASRVILIVMLFLVVLRAASAADHESAYALIKKGDAAALAAMLKEDPYIASSRNGNGMPLLLRACMTDKLDCVKVLLAAGADVKVTDKNLQRTPLHCAAGWSTLEMVEFLVGNGADINAMTVKGDTPLDFARDNFYRDKHEERDKITNYLIRKGAK